MAVAMVFPLEDYQLACCKLGDSSWTLLPPLSIAQEADDVLFYQGYLYGMSSSTELMVMDLYHDPQYKWKIISTSLYYTCINFVRSGWCHYYLAEINGEIVVIVRARVIRHRHRGHKTVKVGVFKYTQEKWCQIKDTGNCCLFLGTTMSLCLSPVPRDYCPNSIYFTDDLIIYRINPPPIRGCDMVKFSLDDNKFSKFYDGTSESQYSPPIWLTLNP